MDRVGYGIGLYLKMDIIRDTIKELESLNVTGTLSNVLVTKTQYSPWTMSYVRYDDGMVGCGLANNELKVPDNTEFIEELLSLNVYDTLEELYNMESSVFLNSLILSIVSALSHKVMNDEGFLRKTNFEIENLMVGAETGLETPPENPLFKFVKTSDVVALVGFASWWIPYLSQKTKEVNVTELVDPEVFAVTDFCPDESNVQLFHADMNEEVLNKADVAYITGETIVNGTIEELLEFSRNARAKIIYGPTSSFYPKALFERGIDASLAIVLPSTSDFKRQFVLSSGYCYSMFEKMLLVKRST